MKEWSPIQQSSDRSQTRPQQSILEFPFGSLLAAKHHRETFNNYSYQGAYARGDAQPTVQDMPKYHHLNNLLNNCYDRGSRVGG